MNILGLISQLIGIKTLRLTKRTPNPHPERHFWEFNGLLVSFGNFWVLSDCVPYLQRLTVEHGNFVTNFKLNAGLGGPMLSRISWKSGLTWDL